MVHRNGTIARALAARLRQISLAWQDGQKGLTGGWLWTEWPGAVGTYLWLKCVFCGHVANSEQHVAAAELINLECRYQPASPYSNNKCLTFYSAPRAPSFFSLYPAHTRYTDDMRSALTLNLNQKFSRVGLFVDFMVRPPKAVFKLLTRRETYNTTTLPSTLKVTNASIFSCSKRLYTITCLP